MKPFERILIANRGEIAVRIMRTCRALGIETVAIYSDADARALHVLQADQAVHIGASTPAESYLNIEKIIAACQSSGASGLHPGYGFLSEQPALGRACREAGITFIGPTPEAQELLGSKTASRALMKSKGVSTTPGTEAQAWTPDSLAAAAAEIGFPLLLKAAAGGGGKGMRAVRAGEDLFVAFESAQREALSAFGDGSIFVEKLIEKPRHVEIQILADEHGNCIHLGERECSIQRRHQKVIEETPSVAVDAELRARMGEVAVAAALAAGYTSAGTVEFLLDAEGGFYFLEMNARLQVEHPVTEMVTGIDLVRAQIQIAAGEKLELTQEEVIPRGHAIEVRIYAEDPARDFMPSPGKILALAEPTGPGIRCDSGVYAGFEVPLDYDPILAKLIAFGENREVARRRMVSALESYVVLGIETPIAFLRDVLRHEAFISGETQTDFIPQHFANWQAEQTLGHEAVALVALAARLRANVVTTGTSSETVGPPSPWQTLGGWTLEG